MEVKRLVTSDTRRLAILFVQFPDECRRLIPDRTVDVKDMINQDEFPSLQSAILHVTSSFDQAPIVLVARMECNETIEGMWMQVKRKLHCQSGTSCGLFASYLAAFQ